MRDLYYTIAQAQRYKENLNARVKAGELKAENRDLLIQFIEDYGVSKRLKHSRIAKYLGHFAKVLVFYPNGLGNPSKQAFLSFVKAVETMDKAEATKAEYIVMLKTFYKWWEEENRKTMTEEQREALYWLNHANKNGYVYKIDQNKVEEKEPITERDYLRLISATHNSRDKAITAMFWELGVRAGELLNMRLKDVKKVPDGYEVRITVSKTRKRTLILINGAPYLDTYLHEHPTQNADDYLFLSMDKNHHPLEYRALKLQMEKAALRANIKKKVYPHLFRHTCATRKAALGWNEAQLCNWFGWSIGSKSPRTYIHKSGIDNIKIARQAAGLEPVPEVHDESLRPIICGACHTANEVTNHFCKSCGEQLLKHAPEASLSTQDIKVLISQMAELKADVLRLREQKA